MSLTQIKSVQDLTEEFEKFPGIGPKSAARIVYFILNAPESRAFRMSELINKVKKEVRKCNICANLTDKEICVVCTDNSRKQNSICLVEDPLDVIAIDNSDIYSGLYHVLGGVISPLMGIGPENLNFFKLKERLNKIEGPKELIIALNPTMEGEATSMYILDYLKDVVGLDISRIARGMPTGGDIEYADYMTLKKSIENRVKY